MHTYATLADVRAELKAAGSQDDGILRRLLGVASARIDGLFYETRPLFLPYRETRQFWVTPGRVSSRDSTLDLYWPVVELIDVTVTNVPVPLTAVTLWPPAPQVPRQLKLSSSHSWYAFPVDGTGRPLASVTAVWGYHTRRAQAWSPVDILASAVSASANVWLVTDVDGTDDAGHAPRFSPGNWARVDDEYVEVVAVDPTANTLTVRRGVGGTTATAHATDALVAVWQPEPLIRRATARYAALLYARRGAFEGTTLTDVGRWSFPPDLQAELRGILQVYAYGWGTM